MGDFFGCGAIMGWTPAETKICTPFEFWSAWEGWAEANSSHEPEPMTRDELREIIKEHGLGGRLKPASHKNPS